MIIKSKIYFAFIVSALFFGGLASMGHAASIGTSAIPFLTLKTSARSEAMAGAVTASGDDLSSFATNPASLSRIKLSETLFTQAMFFENIKYSYMAYAQPTKWGVPSIEYMSLSYGEFDATNADREKTGTQTPKDMFYGIGWSANAKRWFSDRLDLGGSFRYIKSDLGIRQATAFSVNLGASYRSPFEGVTFGVALNNMGSSIQYNNTSFSQPRTLRMGVSYMGNEFTNLSARMRYSLDGILPRDEKMNFAGAVELSFMRIMTAQIGFAGDEGRESRLRYGFGLGLDAFQMSYSAAPTGSLGTNHRITLRLRFGSGIWNLVHLLSKDTFVKQDLDYAKEYYEKQNYERALFYVNKVKGVQQNNEVAKNIELQIEQIHNMSMAEDIYQDGLLLNKMGHTMESLNKMAQAVKLNPYKTEYQVAYTAIKTTAEKSTMKHATDQVRASLTIVEDNFLKFRGLGLPEEVETAKSLDQAHQALDSENPSEAEIYVSKSRSLLDQLVVSLKKKAFDRSDEVSRASAVKTLEQVAAETKSQEPKVAAVPPKKRPSMQKAEAETVQEAAVDPETLKNDYQQGVGLMEGGQAGEAIPRFMTVVSKDKNFMDAAKRLAECFKSRGINYYSVKEYDLAEKDFDQAIKFNPKDTDLLKYLRSARLMRESMIQSSSGRRYE